MTNESDFTAGREGPGEKGPDGGGLRGLCPELTTKDISEGLHKQFGIDITNQNLVLDEQIKAFGNYQVKARLGYEVTATVYVSVFEEK